MNPADLINVNWAEVFAVLWGGLAPGTLVWWIIKGGGWRPEE